MSSVEYIPYRQYLSYEVNSFISGAFYDEDSSRCAAGTVRANFLLAGQRDRHQPHDGLWHLKKGRALGINFDTLEKPGQALGCQPADALSLTNGKKIPKRRRAKGP